MRGGRHVTARPAAVTRYKSTSVCSLGPFLTAEPPNSSGSFSHGRYVEVQPLNLLVFAPRPDKKRRSGSPRVFERALRCHSGL